MLISVTTGNPKIETVDDAIKVARIVRLLILRGYGAANSPVDSPEAGQANDFCETLRNWLNNRGMCWGDGVCINDNDRACWTELFGRETNYRVRPDRRRASHRAKALKASLEEFDNFNSLTGEKWGDATSSHLMSDLRDFDSDDDEEEDEEPEEDLDVTSILVPVALVELLALQSRLRRVFRSAKVDWTYFDKEDSER